MVRRGGSIHQKRSLGQVFLKVTWPTEKVVERMSSFGVTKILEIGPGGGMLTRALLQAGFSVTAVEKDDRFAEKLNDYKRTVSLRDGQSFEVVNQDILKFPLESWLARGREPVAVCGNIPYNISSSILLWVLPYLDQLKGVEFLVQLEFALRLSALPGHKTYGSISIYTQLRSRVKLECKVGRECFHPIPKVDSALITLTPLAQKYPDSALKWAEQVTRLAFQQRRKKLSNALMPLLTEHHPCPIDLTRRPESLSPQEYIELGQFLLGQKGG